VSEQGYYSWAFLTDGGEKRALSPAGGENKRRLKILRFHLQPAWGRLRPVIDKGIRIRDHPLEEESAFLSGESSEAGKGLEEGG